ncbi:MAG TPA: ArsI/CadI family heavy metal resistance metalloenzyme [Pseudonocardiaceae bacterium]
MSRVQLALRVGDLEGSIAFYSTLFGVEPAKRRPGYANFAVAEPPLKLVLLEGEPGQATVLDHLGVEVSSTEEVTQAAERLAASGLSTQVENDTTCCYAVQDKVWVRGPGQEPWEVYVVKDDSATFRAVPVEDTAPTGCSIDTWQVDAAQGSLPGPVGCCTRPVDEPVVREEA